jgi:hypothetical protein
LFLLDWNAIDKDLMLVSTSCFCDDDIVTVEADAVIHDDFASSFLILLLFFNTFMSLRLLISISIFVKSLLMTANMDLNLLCTLSSVNTSSSSTYLVATELFDTELVDSDIDDDVLSVDAIIESEFTFSAVDDAVTVVDLLVDLSCFLDDKIALGLLDNPLLF